MLLDNARSLDARLEQLRLWMNEESREMHPIHFVADLEELLEGPLEFEEYTPVTAKQDAIALAGFIRFVNMSMGGGG